MLTSNLQPKPITAHILDILLNQLVSFLSFGNMKLSALFEYMNMQVFSIPQNPRL